MLNNFESMLLGNMQPEDGKIESNKLKKVSDKHCKGVYKFKTHVYKTLDECINESNFSFNAYLKGQSKQTKKHYSKANQHDNAPIVFLKLIRPDERKKNLGF